MQLFYRRHAIVFYRRHAIVFYRRHAIVFYRRHIIVFYRRHRIVFYRRHIIVFYMRHIIVFYRRHIIVFYRRHIIVFLHTQYDYLCFYRRNILSVIFEVQYQECGLYDSESSIQKLPYCPHKVKSHPYRNTAVFQCKIKSMQKSWMVVHVNKPPCQHTAWFAGNTEVGPLEIMPL